MFKKNQRRTVKKTFMYFCNNSSVQILKFLATTNLNTFEKTFWICYNAVIFIVAAYVIGYVWKAYHKYPVVVTPEYSSKLMNSISFPGVAICNINKISRMKAVQLAESLAKFDPEQTVPELLEKIKLLGYYYEASSINHKELQSFQNLLNKFDGGEKNPTIRLLDLSPSCENMLKECNWRGKRYECDNLIFTMETFNSFCCVFNYARRSSKFDILDDIDVLRGSGIEQGLRLTLNNDYDDYFLTTLESSGYMVYIFDPNEFPDKISGSLSEILVNFGTETLISIDPNLIRSSEGMKFLPMSMRTCKFPTDENTIFGQYRASDCFYDCKLKSIKSLCECVPFGFPSDNEDFCTLDDLQCLNEHKIRWSRYYPGVDSPIFNLEKVESLHCSHCYPSCNNVIYNVFTNTIRNNRNNNTYINIFFKREFGGVLENDVIMTWFEIISNFGGLISIFMGWSVISLIEVIFFISKIIWLSFIKT